MVIRKNNFCSLKQNGFQKNRCMIDNIYLIIFDWQQHGQHISNILKKKSIANTLKIIKKL